MFQLEGDVASGQFNVKLTDFGVATDVALSGDRTAETAGERQFVSVDLATNTKRKSRGCALSPKLHVRDDGTVEEQRWKSLLRSAEYSTALWARINGRELDSVEDETVLSASSASASASATGHHAAPKTSKPVTAKIIETPQIIEARDKLDDTLSSQLVEMEKEHYKSINSAISQGQLTDSQCQARSARTITAQSEPGIGGGSRQFQGPSVLSNASL